ncbi:MAG: ATP-binding protein [Acidimicrobiales bacterium]
MRVTRLYLQNYRVYEQPVDLELPPGLVGVYGLNGSGKSTLLESIRFALFGKARTSLDQVRTSEVKADCVAEVEFEHEGHLYLVRRTITGANTTVKAKAFADKLQVAEGALDTARYVHSILGMDDKAFRASVFAEQKQLAALSQQRPEERRKLVLQLLGITPVDAARDRARTQARDASQQVERLRSLLPDVDALKAQAAESAALAAEAAEVATTNEERAAALQDRLAKAEVDYEGHDTRRQEHERMAAEVAATRAELTRATTRAAKLAGELADLERAAHQLAVLEPEAEGCDAVEARFRALQAVVEAAKAVDAVTVPPEPDAIDEDAFERDRSAADRARAALAGIEGAHKAAEEERQRAATAVERSGRLTAGADCPLCGQALGDAFEQVQAHRARELAEVDERLGALVAERRLAAHAAEVAAKTLSASAANQRRLQALKSAYDQAQARHTEARRALDRARQLCPDGDVVQIPQLAAEVRRRRQAAQEVGLLRGRLERRPRLEADLDAERVAVDTATGTVKTLAEKLAAVAFSTDELAKAKGARDRLRTEVVTLQREAQAARLTAAQAAAAAEAAHQRVADAQEQHAKLGQQVRDAAHLQRLGDLLHSFRNTLVASAGPRLSAQAANLFAELTDHEYDDLEVDPETYEIKVSDQGHKYGMDRFSGSETDLANLALRVAISEHVQFQSGGTVGLLVLDEVFGPLDDDRKDRMLQALERLKARFRQVLVVTHDSAIKEQLPHAIEVVKLPNRRASVRLVTA